ncbi:SDR family NAD(P)-dependent oxidoreductase [Hyphococcus sp.]|uniref:SDR family NAD(P)-dependent oxidoreductase n=1 Tax=Hyphococcus sp. TaxID=2038636 RepID=UPI003D0DAC42
MTNSVLITGAAGGIGSALVRAFAGAGWMVIGTDSAKPKSASGAFIEADLSAFATDPVAVADFAKDVRKAAKSAPLRALVNNAAVQRLGRLDRLDHDDIVETFNVNVAAPMLLAKALLPELEAAKGVIINMGSVHAQATKPGFSAYAASKAAIHGLTRALAVDLGPKVRAVTLAPAAVSTPMLMAGFDGKEDAFNELESVHPAGRIASPEEIAKIAVFLASNEAAFMTGTCVYADGGVLSRLHDPA